VKPLEVVRVLATLALSLVLALALCLGATRWLPPGAGGIDHYLLAAMAFPVVWLGASLWLVGARRRARAFAALGALALASALLVWFTDPR